VFCKWHERITVQTVPRTSPSDTVACLFISGIRVKYKLAVPVMAIQLLLVLVCVLSKRNQCTHKKDNIKPAMVKIKLKFTKYLGDDGSILCWHVHPHQQN